jgi:uncharacterized membrane protein YgdD (TMEM256/DUF423 family)
MTKKILLVAGIIGALSIIMDALGNLYFLEFISDDDLIIYNHGVLYQMIHALALIGVVFLNRYFKPKYINIIFLMFIAGTILVSGTLYLISLGNVFKFEFSMLRPFTVIGGLLLIVGWLGIANLGINYKSKKR